LEAQQSSADKIGTPLLVPSANDDVEAEGQGEYGTPLPPMPRGPGGPGAAVLQPDELERATLQAYDTALAAEPRDAAWAASTERDLVQNVNRPELGSGVLHAVRCSSSFCKMQATFPSVEDREKFLLLMHSTPPWSSWGEAFLRMESEEDLTIELYFSREGRMLPSIPVRVE
jgi:hypothetical protein